MITMISIMFKVAADCTTGVACWYLLKCCKSNWHKIAEQRLVSQAAHAGLLNQPTTTPQKRYIFLLMFSFSHKATGSLVSGGFRHRHRWLFPKWSNEHILFWFKQKKKWSQSSINITAQEGTNRTENQGYQLYGHACATAETQLSKVRQWWGQRSSKLRMKVQQKAKWHVSSEKPRNRPPSLWKHRWPLKEGDYTSMTPTRADYSGLLQHSTKNYSISLICKHQNFFFFSAVCKWNATWMGVHGWVEHISKVRVYSELNWLGYRQLTMVVTLPFPERGWIISSTAQILVHRWYHENGDYMGLTLTSMFNVINLRKLPRNQCKSMSDLQPFKKTPNASVSYLVFAVGFATEYRSTNIIWMSPKCRRLFEPVSPPFMRSLRYARASQKWYSLFRRDLRTTAEMALSMLQEDARCLIELIGIIPATTIKEFSGGHANPCKIGQA